MKRRAHTDTIHSSSPVDCSCCSMLLLKFLRRFFLWCFFPQNLPHCSEHSVRVLITRTLLFFCFFVLRLSRVLPIFTNLTSFSLLLHGGGALSFSSVFALIYTAPSHAREILCISLFSSPSSSVAARGSTNHLSRIDHTRNSPKQRVHLSWH